MQTPIPGRRPFSPPSDSLRILSVTGEIVAWVVLGVSVFLFLISLILRQLQVGVFLFGLLGLFLLIAPWLALIGCGLCIAYLLVTDQARWSTIIALIVQLSFVCIGVSTMVTAGMTASAKKGLEVKLDENLAGTVDREKGIYEAPEKSFRVANDYLKSVAIFDKKDAEKNTLGVLIIVPRSPQWSIEMIPALQSGVPKGISPEEFVEFVGKQIAADQTLFRENVTTPAGPALRTLYKRRSANRSSEIWMTDHFIVGSTWYRVSAYDLVGANTDEDKKELSQAIQELWKGLEISKSPAAEPTPAPVPFSVPDSLSQPIDAEKFLKFPDSATLPDPKP